MDRKKLVLVALSDLTLLCLNVDYIVPSHTKDLLENLSVRLAKRHRFDTHLWRMKNNHVNERAAKEENHV